MYRNTSLLYFLHARFVRATYADSHKAIRRLDPELSTACDAKRTPGGDAEGPGAERRRGVHIWFRDPWYDPHPFR